MFPFLLLKTNYCTVPNLYYHTSLFSFLPQHNRPISFLVQPWLQHIPATPREKFLFFLVTTSRSAASLFCTCSPKAMDSLGRPGEPEDDCCLSFVTVKRVKRSASELEAAKGRGELSSLRSVSYCQVLRSASGATSPREVQWNGSGGRKKIILNLLNALLPRWF